MATTDEGKLAAPTNQEQPSASMTRPSDGATPSVPPDFCLLLIPGSKPLLDYELVSPLGKGSFGEVWKAVGPGEVPVALKFIRLDDRVAEAELRSLELIKKIRHPNLLGTSGIWKSRRDAHPGPRAGRGDPPGPDAPGAETEPARHPARGAATS